MQFGVVFYLGVNSTNFFVEGRQVAIKNSV